jgi:aryl-alcohol dehydrogenase-like predicted oxidoreductase
MTISTSVPTLLLGTSNVGPAPASTPFTHDSAEKVAALLDCWYDLGGRYIDTAAQYGETKEHGAGGSERRLKEAGAGQRFVIDTKVHHGRVRG